MYKHKYDARDNKFRLCERCLNGAMARPFAGVTGRSIEGTRRSRFKAFNVEITVTLESL